MANGTIRNLVKDRGFGFIQVEGSSDEVFFHTSAVADGGFDNLSVGQALEFDVEKIAVTRDAVALSTSR